MDPVSTKEAVDVLVPLSFFAMIAVIVTVPRYFKSLERQKMADTVRAAIEKGQPLPPEVIAALTPNDRKIRPPAHDLLLWLPLVSLSLFLSSLFLLLFPSSPPSLHALVGAAAIPGFIGLPMIAIYLVEKPRA